MADPVGLTREEAREALYALEAIREIQKVASPLRNTTIAKLRALASGDPSPSLPAEPSTEALNAAYDAYTDLGEDNFDAVRAALRAAYRVDSQ